MKSIGVNLKKIDKMAGLAFKNCLRLHLDSILLFNHRTYPSAFFLSVLSLEELGKTFLLSDFVWHSSVDGRYNLIEDEELKKEYGGDIEKFTLKRIYSHNTKQRHFAFNTLGLKPTKFMKSIYNNAIELQKQNSMYVGFDRKKGKINLKSKIKHPFNTTRKKALKQITHLNDSLLKLVLRCVIEQSYLDLESIESIVTKKLYMKLQAHWRFKNNIVAKRLKKWEKHL